MGLEETLKKKKEETIKGEIRWEEIRDRWISSVRELFKSIRERYEPYEKDGLLTINEVKQIFNEEHIGRYELSILEIIMNDVAVIIQPVGRNILGAEGRIDLYRKGNYADKYIIFGEADGKRIKWSLADRRAKVLREFNLDVLDQKLEEWVG